MIITPYSFFFSLLWGSILLLFLLLTKKKLLSHNCYKCIFVCILLIIIRYMFIFDLPIDLSNSKLFFITRNITKIAKESFNLIPVSYDYKLSLYEFIVDNNIVWYLLTIWGGGFLILVFRDIFYLRKCKKNTYKLTLVPNNIVNATIERVQKDINKSFSVKLVQSKYVQVPFIHGLIFPTIYLGTSIKSDEELYFILRHEFTHFVFRDNWLKFILRYIVLFFWWNPLMRILPYILEKACEYRCDQSVTKDMDILNKLEYASTINRISSKELVSFQSTKFISAFVPKKNQDNIHKRLLAFLDPKPIKPISSIILISTFSFITIGSFIFSFPTILQRDYAPSPSMPYDVTVTKENGYLIENSDGSYSLYVYDILIDSHITDPNEYDLQIK